MWRIQPRSGGHITLRGSATEGRARRAVMSSAVRIVQAHGGETTLNVETKTLKDEGHMDD